MQTCETGHVSRARQRRTVRRAIVMAAGKGERMRPLTQSMPKPLIRVHGERMIDSIVKALHQNGIFEICVVVGYRKEQFAGLPAEYPGLCLVENPDWERCNNISSLYAARQYLDDCIILDGDQLIRTPAVLAPEFTRSGYNAVWTEKETREWLLTVQDNRITRCSRTGGRHGWQLYSVSRWTAEDGARLQKHLEMEFREKGNTGLYWDDVALFLHPEDYELGVFPMREGDVTEIDTLEELAAEDPVYRSLIGKGS